jgi:hypothetical protein
MALWFPSKIYAEGHLQQQICHAGQRMAQELLLQW